MIEVRTDSCMVSENETLYAQVSQCVALGIINKKHNLTGITHIHCNNYNLEFMINRLLENTQINPEKMNEYDLAVCGGTDAFIQGYYLPGERCANKVMQYLHKIRIDNINEVDVHGNYIRKLIANPENNTLSIFRL